ncbi:YjjG family noncanonical pyrimidine nucleotidase [Candidatus Bipolaricaulota bacterium]|nr:YjjG family noncanonical pyrimidine nucleotidase [Candidatus Bipolaricaulota bacterium]
MSRYAWLLFDADGTLFDFQRAESIALKNTPFQMGLVVPAGYVETYHRINTLLWESFEAGDLLARDVRTKRFQWVFESLGIAGDAQAFSETFLRNLVEASTFLAEAKPLLAQLKLQYRLSLLTNGFADVQHARIARLGVASLFESIIISEEVGVAKPDPAIFDIVLERMGWPDKSTVLMIGDSLSSDILGGSNAGIDTCWFNPESKPNDSDVAPTYEIRRLGELRALLAIKE